MRFLVQRVKSASVTVDGKVVGSINHGLLVFIGITGSDDEFIAEKMVDKLVKLRIFDDENGKTNLSVNDVKGEILEVSQFTLYADMSHGNRPSFVNAAEPQKAEKLYEYIIECTRNRGFDPGTGIFGADMKVDLLNDGPFTVMMDSEEIVKNK